MNYVLIEQDDGLQLYQCIRDGVVVCYKTASGELTEVVGGSRVVDADAPPPKWDAPDPAPDPAPPASPGVRRVSKLQFVALLGGDFLKILAVSKQNVQVEMFVRMLDWATPEADGTSVDLDDPRVVGALEELEAYGVIGMGRARGIVDA